MAKSRTPLLFIAFIGCCPRLLANTSARHLFIVGRAGDSVYYKTTDDRRTELQRLVEELERLVAWIIRTGHFADAIPVYRECQEEARRLLGSSFTQEDLCNLSQRIPRLIHLHPRWEPPLVEAEPGRWTLPAWYVELEPIHVAAFELVTELRVVGPPFRGDDPFSS